MSNINEYCWEKEEEERAQEQLEQEKAALKRAVHQCEKTQKGYELGYQVAYDEYVQDIDAKIETLQAIRNRSFTRRVSRAR